MSILSRLARVTGLKPAPPPRKPAKPTKKAPVKKKPAPPKKDPGRMDTFARLPVPGGVCPICGETSVENAMPYPSDVSPFRKWVVYFCSACGCGHVPDAEPLLGDYYANEYATKNRKDRKVDPETYFNTEPEGLKSRYYTRANAQIEALRERGATFDRVLDFGSGPGYLLHRSGAQEMHAVELDEMSFKYLDYLGAKRHAPDALPQGYFDAIVASHVIEHFTDTTVTDLVSGMISALRPGGMILVEVPNGSISRFVLPSRHDPHTIFFTPEGLRTLIQRCDGEIVANYLRSQFTYTPQPNPIYSPDPADHFASSSGGGTTVIATRSETA